jgi:alginate O-acetyltransferase complex protein AlgI
MIFNSVTYLLFLSLVVSLFWILPRRLRLWMIFSSSLVFYGFWRPEFVVVMVFSAFTDFFVAKRIEHDIPQPTRRRWLALSLTVNLGLLFFFKYLLFAVDNAIAVFHFFGVDLHAPALNIILPLGISFYTFQTISYVVDVYRRNISAEKDFLIHGCFVTFFPQLVAGPILRGGELLSQLSQKPTFHLSAFFAGVRRILFGLFLKVVIADNLAPLVEVGFSASAEEISAIDVLTLAFLFGFQIYCDFSAYSHIALGSARLMGIHFPENCVFPYIARSPKEFWQRWHISLSSWVRDYLYLPLIGARSRDYSTGGLVISNSGGRGKSRYRIFVLFITWGLMGFWHGANWTYLFWGFYHATFILAYRVCEPVRIRLPRWVRDTGGWFITLFVSMLAWIPFRASSLEEALEMLERLIHPSNYTWLGMRENNYLIASLLLVSFLLAWLVHRERNRIARLPALLSFGLETALASVVAGLTFVFLRPINQFIYFQF